jgi:hypothetical protein
VNSEAGEGKYITKCWMGGGGDGEEWNNKKIEEKAG